MKEGEKPRAGDMFIRATFWVRTGGLQQGRCDLPDSGDGVVSDDVVTNAVSGVVDAFITHTNSTSARSPTTSYSSKPLTISGMVSFAYYPGGKLNQPSSTASFPSRLPKSGSPDNPKNS